MTPLEIQCQKINIELRAKHPEWFPEPDGWVEIAECDMVDVISEILNIAAEDCNAQSQ